MKKEYEFKHENWGDEWQPFEPKRSRYYYDAEDVAREIGEDNYNDEPCDPYRFQFEIEVREVGSSTSKKFSVSAEADVNFYSREIEDEAV
jgi:hypothetical protein